LCSRRLRVPNHARIGCNLRQFDCSCWQAQRPISASDRGSSRRPPPASHARGSLVRAPPRYSFWHTGAFGLRGGHADRRDRARREKQRDNGRGPEASNDRRSASRDGHTGDSLGWEQGEQGSARSPVHHQRPEIHRSDSVCRPRNVRRATRLINGLARRPWLCARRSPAYAHADRPPARRGAGPRHAR
jgi:hypothetical protein